MFDGNFDRHVPGASRRLFEGFGIGGPEPDGNGGIESVIAAANWKFLLNAGSQPEGDGDPISLALDQSGNGLDWTGVTTSRPLLRKTGLAGAPAFEFDGINDILTAPGGMTGLTQKCGGMLILEESLGFDGQAWDGSGFSFGGAPSVLTNNSFGDAEDFQWKGHNGATPLNRVIKANGTTSAGPHVITWSCDGATSGLIVRFDGVEVINVTNERDYSTGLGSPFVPVTVGLGSGTSFFEGDIATLGITDQDLTTAQMQIMEQFAGDTYGVTLP